MSSQKREREDDDEEDAGDAAYRGLGAAESPHRDYDDDGDGQTEDDDEEMRDLEDSDDDDLAFFGGGPVSSDSVSDSWLSAALLEGQQELANALEPLGSLAVAWATPSGDLSAGFVRLDFNLLLLSTSFDRRAADCLGLRLELSGGAAIVGGVNETRLEEGQLPLSCHDGLRDFCDGAERARYESPPCP